MFNLTAMAAIVITFPKEPLLFFLYKGANSSYNLTVTFQELRRVLHKHDIGKHSHQNGSDGKLFV